MRPRPIPLTQYRLRREDYPGIYGAVTPHQFSPCRNPDGSTQSVGLMYWTETLPEEPKFYWDQATRQLVRRMRGGAGLRLPTMEKKVVECMRCGAPAKTNARATAAYCPDCKEEAKRDRLKKDAEYHRKRAGRC